MDILGGVTNVVKVDQSHQIVWVAGEDTARFKKTWIAKSTDKGDTWQVGYLRSPYESNSVTSLVFHPFYSDTIYVGMYSQVIKTSNAGIGWKLTGLKHLSVNFTALAIDLFNPYHIWAGGIMDDSSNRYQFWESFDGGDYWQQVVPSQQSDLAGISSLVADPTEPGVVYISTLGDGVWRYQSKEPSLALYFPLQVGNWWTFSKAITETIIDSMKISDNLYFQFDQFCHFPNALLRMTSDNKLLLRDNAMEQVWLDFSANIGDSWKVFAQGGVSEWTVHLQSKTDTVKVPAGYFTNCYRFWFQFSGADNDWEEWYAPGVGPVKRTLYGFGLIEYPLSAAYVNGFYLPTKIDETPESSKPDQFYLYPNYPNPFNGTTVIPFDLPHSSYVVLEIYNIMGKKVRTLLADQKPAGHFEVQWNGTDELNQTVASGIYFCRLQATKAPGEVLVWVRKLVLLR
ncbi:MAG TPA: FlgD immunoglobulin-like domain containing protein [bacterium]